MSLKICVVGTHHAYQYAIMRQGYFQEVENLVSIHSVDLIAEEATGIRSTYAEGIARNAGILWKNVDLTRDERKHVPDINPLGIGTLQDCDLHLFREWIWVVRTTKAMNCSALLICGLAHLTGLAEKFRFVGCEVELNVWLDRNDFRQIEGRREYPGAI